MVDVYTASIPDCKESFTESTGKTWPWITLGYLAGSLVQLQGSI